MEEFNINVIKEDKRLPTGKIAVWTYVKHTGAVMVLPILNDKEIIMIRQYRPAIGKWVYELPAGAIEGDENPSIRAEKELAEETGFTAESIKPLFESYSSPGFSTEKIFFFTATGLKKGEQRLEENEIIEVEKIKLSKALEMIKNNKVESGHAIQAILFYCFAR